MIKYRNDVFQMSAPLCLALLILSAVCAYGAQDEFAYESFEFEMNGDPVFYDLNGDGLKDASSWHRENGAIFILQGSDHRFRNDNAVIYTSPESYMLAPSKADPANKVYFYKLNREGVSILSPGENGESLVEKKIFPAYGWMSDARRFRGSSNIVDFVLKNGDKDVICFPRNEDLVFRSQDESGDWSVESRIPGSADQSVSAFPDLLSWSFSQKIFFWIRDIDGDRRDDLVITGWNEASDKNLFSIYYQKPGGVFSPEPDSQYELEWDPEIRNLLRDINHDGRLDFVAVRDASEPWFIPGVETGKAIVEIRLTRPDGSLPSKPSNVFRKKDYNLSVPAGDLNGDGFEDLGLGYFRWRGREDVIKTVSEKKIDLELRFHFYEEDGFERRPDFTRRVEISITDPWFYMYYIQFDLYKRLIRWDGDFNGDGRLDLAVLEKPDELAVYFFDVKKKRFEKKSRLKFTLVPRRRSYRFEDLNGDGATDIIESPAGRTIIVHMSVKK